MFMKNLESVVLRKLDLTNEVRVVTAGVPKNCMELMSVKFSRIYYSRADTATTMKIAPAVLKATNFV